VTTFVGGLTATACAQWWTTYNPDYIVGCWTESTYTSGSNDYACWTLSL
jgi:hypothetical protein